jgi:hypothetical protein
MSNGIHLEASEKTKSDLYSDLVAVINSRACDLLDYAKLENQLIGLERRTRAGGRDQIDHAPGGHDDVANAVAGAVLHVDKAGSSEFWRPIEYRAYGIV